MCGSALTVLMSSSAADRMAVSACSIFEAWSTVLSSTSPRPRMSEVGEAALHVMWRATNTRKTPTAVESAQRSRSKR
jgi:hypothetical protein